MRSRASVSNSRTQTPGDLVNRKYEFISSFDGEYGRFTDVGKSRYIKTANVSISKISEPRLERLQDKKGKYTSLASLVMLKEEKTFYLVINNFKREERLPIKDIISRKLTPGGKLFTFRFENFELVLDFLHNREAEIFNKYIGRILGEKEELEIYEIPESTSTPVTKKPKGMFLSVAVMVSESIEDVIKDVIATEWTFRHVKYWLQHIHVQPEKEGGEIISLHEYIVRIDFEGAFEKYFDEGNTIYNLEKELIAYNMDPEKVEKDILPIAGNEILRQKLIKQIEIIQLNEGFFAKEYYLVLKKRIESAKKHLKKSNDPNLVLSLNHLESRMMHEELHLWNKRYLRNYLLFSILFNRSIVSYIENMTKIFENLLQQALEKDNRKSASLVVEQVEEEEENEGEEGEDDDDESDEGDIGNSDREYEEILRKEKAEIKEEWQRDALYLNHRTFEGVLGSFNTTNNIHLEVLSFPIWLRVKQNLLRRRREKLRDRTKPLERRERELMIEVEEARGKSERWKEKLEGMAMKAQVEEAREKKEREDWLKMNPGSEENGLGDPGCDMKEKKRGLMMRCQKMKEKYESSLHELEKKLSGVRVDLRDTRMDIPIRRKKYNTEILSYSPQLVDERLEKEFLVKKHRFQMLEKMIEMKADEVIQKSPVDYSVKLVLSYQRNPDQRRERPPSRKKNYYVDWLHRGDEILHFPFFRFGLVHASLIIKNVNFHWLANSLVRVNEIREDLNTTFNEVSCVDVDCPMIFLNKKSLLEKFEQIAGAIVFWNAGIMYSDWHLPLLESNSRNCQEFVSFMMENVLNYTPYFDIVQRYVERDLKNWVRDKYRSKEPGWRNLLMFFPVKEEFKAKFKKVFEEHFHLLWTPKKTGIVFRSHDELDNLVHSLKQATKEEMLEVQFPGEFQLLKSLDRAFWIKMRRGDSENNEPSQQFGCPFNRSVSHKKRRKK